MAGGISQTVKLWRKKLKYLEEPRHSFHPSFLRNYSQVFGERHTLAAATAVALRPRLDPPTKHSVVSHTLHVVLRRKGEKERESNPPLVIGARNHSAEKQGGIEEEGRISVCRARQTATQVCGGRRGGEDEGLLIPKSLLRRRREGERGCWDHKRISLIEE